MPRNNTIDLNIGTQCLENWENHHAIRELIANALDEHIISKITQPIAINHSRNKCEIIDYGSGITKSSFIIQSNSNKLSNEKLIGQFGFGMKDAIAVLCKNDIDVTIYTRDFIFTPSYTQRANTSDITLHITFINNNDYDDDEYGTKIVLNNIKKTDIEKAKDYFIDFTTIKFDNIYSNTIMKFNDKSQYIFVNKFRVCKTKKNTYFSYNIKKTKDVMKFFNRDRGEKDYASFRKIITIILKDIDIYCDKYSTEQLRNEIKKILSNDNLLEFNQIDVIRNILSQLNESDDYIFIDEKDKQLVKKKNYVKKIKDSGREIIFIGSGILKKINSIIKTDKIKNIKELCDPTKIFVRNEKGLFTLSSPSMFPPQPIDELVKKIKEMIQDYRTKLEIVISKKIEKTLTTIEIIDDDGDNNDDSDNESNSDSDDDDNDNKKYNKKSKNESEDDSKNDNSDEEFISCDEDEKEKEDKKNNNKDYYFEDGIFNIKKSVIENENRTNELKAVIFDYILKNIKPSDSLKILELIMNKIDKSQRPWYYF